MPESDSSPRSTDLFYHKNCLIKIDSFYLPLFMTYTNIHTICIFYSDHPTHSLCPRGKGQYQVSSNRNNKIEWCRDKRVPLTSLRGPSPNTSAVAWQGPLRHPKGTTVVKINLAASLLRPAAENERGRRGLYEPRAGIPILANCFVGRLPKL